MSDTFKVGKYYRLCYGNSMPLDVNGTVWVVDWIDKEGRAHGRVLWNQPGENFAEWNSALPSCHEELSEEEVSIFKMS